MEPPTNGVIRFGSRLGMTRFTSLYPPIALIVAVLAVWGGQELGFLPSSASILEVLTSWLLKGGAVVIVFVSLLENVVFLNIYFPGSVVILGVMASTQGNFSAALLVFFSIFIGQVVGLIISCFLGGVLHNSKRSTSTDNSVSRLTILLFWHPHVASATAFALGVNSSKFRYIICIVGCLMWSVFWAAVMYFGFGAIINELGWDIVSFIAGIAWLLYEIYHMRRRSAVSQ